MVEEVDEIEKGITYIMLLSIYDNTELSGNTEIVFVNSEKAQLLVDKQRKIDPIYSND